MTEQGERGEQELRRGLVATGVSMNQSGLNQGTSGNISVRCGRDFLITPSALPYEQCGPADMVRLDMAGAPQDRRQSSSRRPSSEWRLHRDLYQARPEAGAILHSHSIWCTVLACLEKEIPPFHYMVAVAGGDSIPCAPYALFGSQELSDRLLATIGQRRACLLAHHGMVCYAAELEQLIPLATEVETLARMYGQALQIAEPPRLSRMEMAAVLGRFADYKAS
ncbi:class II aldolase/adducin family protein [Desulfogranum mediterraneum]|uniref:class II aldolase/adducin family protein n=1 Tax=Desulfogranum mediterraneum TaxID=160661 RepID=UPI000424C705|nr:class II aldolase/adducin family protein [Desulfogranum mediterraneum]